MASLHFLLKRSFAMWLALSPAWAQAQPEEIPDLCEVLSLQPLPVQGLSNGDEFGFAVSLSGTTALIGAPGTDSSASNAGAAWVGAVDGDSWSMLVAPDPDPNDRFGHAVAIWEDDAVVGAPFDDEFGVDAGAAYVFHRTDGVWTLVQKLQGLTTDAGAQFGRAVALEDDRMLIGAPLDFDDWGSVQPFTRQGAVWEASQEPITFPISGAFGHSMEISGNTAIVGAPGCMTPQFYGSAVFCGFADGLWTIAAGWNIGGHACAQFGSVVALEGRAAFAGRQSFWGDVWYMEQLSETYWSLDHVIDGYPIFSMATSADTLWVASTSIHGFRHSNDPWWWQSAGQVPLPEGGGDQVVITLAEELALVGMPQTQNHPGQAMVLVTDQTDQNRNGSHDACDLASGLSQDCNGNGLPDECEAPLFYSLPAGTEWSGYFSYNWGDVLWLNRFTVRNGGQMLTHIGITWSYDLRQPITLMVYDDPNDDGDPADAVLLRSVQAPSMTWDMLDSSLPIGRIAIEPTYVGEPGDSFFVGGYATCKYDCDPLELGNPSQNRSWIKQGGPGELDITDLSSGGSSPQLAPVNWALFGIAADCNSNGVWDQCEIDVDPNIDADENGILDECQTTGCPFDIAPPEPDGVVDVNDLLAIVNAWGPAADLASPDVNQDGAVDVADLLAIINAWGPCS